jgi:hypothetical protein
LGSQLLQEMNYANELIYDNRGTSKPILPLILPCSLRLPTNRAVMAIMLD